MIATVDETELPGEGATALVVNGCPVLLSRSSGKIHAVIDRCTR